MRHNPALMIMAANWVGYVANAVSLIVSARLLGAEGRGAYSAIFVWALTSASVCDLSLGPALARALTIGDSMDRLRHFLPRAYAATAFAATTLMGIFLNTFLARTIHDRWGVVISLTVAPGLIMWVWGLYFFQGLADQARYAIARFLPPVICMALILLQALDRLTVHGLLASVSIGYWLVGIWSAIIAWRRLSKRRVPSPLEGEGRGGGSLLNFGVRAHLGTLASIANARLDLLLLSLIVPLTELGNYALAVSVTTPIAVVGSGLAVANFRRIGADSRPDDVSLIRDVWGRLVRPTIGLACLAGAAAFLIPHVVGHEFDRAVLPTVILALGTSGLGAFYLGMNVLQARGVPGWSSLLAVLAAILSAATLLLLVPRYGIVGAATSSAITYLLVGGLAIPVTLRARTKSGADALGVTAEPAGMRA